MKWEPEQGVWPTAHGTEFHVWAPNATSVEVISQDNNFPLTKQGEFFSATLDLSPGTDYLYHIDGKERPDPASRWQPNGVHAPSRILDPTFAWTDADWKGVPLEEMVLYELHTGLFTSEGSFEAIIEKLPYLKEVGITALSLMPVATFPGDRNWGYDGVNPFAPHPVYGGPHGLKTLINACHDAGLAVVLDVVYNHLGPEGNYLHDFGPYFTDKYQTPWGPAINYDGPHSDPVRQYFIDNALYWLTDYHIDALRLDAVHAIYDFGAHHFLAELHEQFSHQATALGRHAYLIAESDLNDVRLLNPPEKGGYNLDAQWHDDFHHALHVLLTGNQENYFIDFRGVDDFKKAIEEGYVVDGRYSPFRKRHHGSSTKERPGHQFAVFSQNHDQIANACHNKRLSGFLTPDQEKVAAALLLAAPFLPLLFMGQEWGAKTPFAFFTSFDDPALVEAIKQGRHEEINGTGEPLDPQDETLYQSCKLDWSEPKNSHLLPLYKDLLALRKEHPALSNCRKDLTKVTTDPLTIHRSDPSGQEALLLCTLTGESLSPPPGYRLALSTNDPKYGPPGEACCSLYVKTNAASG